MADALDVGGCDGGQHGLDVDDRGGQQRVAQGRAQIVVIPAQIGVLHIEDLADQGVAV